MSLPNQPAIFYVSVNALKNGDIATGFPTTLPVSQYFDIPVFSVRNMILPLLMKDPSQKSILGLFGNRSEPETEVDTLHMNYNGHKAVADLMILYLRKQTCELNRREQSPHTWQHPNNDLWPGPDSLGQVPRLRLLDQWSTEPYPIISQPTCSTVQSSTHPLKPIRMTGGFQHVIINDKKFFATDQIDSRIKFKIKLIEGQVGILHWVTQDKSFGAMICSIDGAWSNDQKWIDGYSDHGMPYLAYSGILWKNLSPGFHTLECKSTRNEKFGGEKFRLVGLTYS
ncbi:uncharacterized protein MELLADRAFT_104473 [Melampsora larici-populina 98AG31]|uniref:Uncharacterized protein n=1 Tax=Melampsora larici-populina (strain 98AG31 / pathotype 3-4-7) TaxID=747676 RepID=F4REU0_MELLP|nr:uncharacterized protein MELLADRAFT_104473 [Melampsora larici-populina 98AG31]EGG09162.1 hypothetical protein MELLADRAFT_104473 [Melampsora larici-populina 98AG31]